MDKIKNDLQYLYINCSPDKNDGLNSCEETLDKLDQILNIIEATREDIDCECKYAIKTINRIIRGGENEN